MPRIDNYKHLDKDYPLRMEMTVPEVAAAIVAQNYGAQRFLSALVHELRKNERPGDPSKLAPVIEDALNQGMFY